MTQKIWSQMIKAIPAGLTAEKAARIFRRSVTLTRRRLKENGYAIKEAKKHEIPAWTAEANWTLPNVDIASKFNLTRERVRQVRKRLGYPFVEARGRQNGKHHSSKD